MYGVWVIETEGNLEQDNVLWIAWTLNCDIELKQFSLQGGKSV